MLTFKAYTQAGPLIEDRARVRRLLDTDNCGLAFVGEYRCDDAVAAVLPAYQAWLQRRLATIDRALTSLGFDVTSPVAWLDERGEEQGVG